MQCDVLEKRKIITSHCPLWGLWGYSFILLNSLLLFLVLTISLCTAGRVKASGLCTVGRLGVQGWHSQTARLAESPVASHPARQCVRG